MWKSVVALAICLWSRPGLAQDPEEIEPKARAELGGLHRAAASLEAVLDLYRVALIELVPAARRVHVAGSSAPAGPATLLPAPSVEVFTRLADNLPNRVPAKSLPVLARGYHAEVADGLERLGTATQLGHVAAPLREITRAMQGVCASARSIVDLFSRQRPVTMELVDPDQMLTDVAQALDQVLAAERRILELRNKKRQDLGSQFRAFRRLEVALGHALDLIAMAEEGGLHIGFEVQLATEDFAALLDRVEKRVAGLDEVVRDLEEPPVSISEPLSAWLVKLESGEIETRLRWQPPRGKPRAAAVRIYRAPNIEGLRDTLAASFRCEGRDPAQARALAEANTEELNDEPELLGEEAPGRSSFAEAWEEAPLSPPRYRVVPVSAFGVEGKGIARVADRLPRELAGATEVRAELLTPPVDDPSFYRDHDAVRVTWTRSASDVSGDVERAALATAEGLPVASWYRILRVDEKRAARNVARVAAGVTEYVDRVDTKTLARGLRYSIETLAETGEAALPPETCAFSEEVRVDLSERVELAKAGIATLGHPNRFERDTEKRLRDPKALAAARRTWMKRPAEERGAALAAWWQSQPEQERRAWLRDWRGLFTARERTALLTDPPSTLSTRDLLRAQVEVWLLGQPPEIRDEVDRWWQLLEPDARARAIDAYKKSANDNVLAWRAEAQLGPEGVVDWGSLRAVRVRTWVASRDDNETAQLDPWWRAMEADQRRQGLARWYETLPEAEKLALHFPDWDTLSDAERGQRLTAPPRMPAELWRRFLAHVAWRDQVARAGDELAATVRADVGGLTAGLTRLRYMTRPFDRALGFHLRLVFAVTAAALVSVFVAWLRWRRRRDLALRG